MALLYGMMKLNHILKLNLIAAHVNHHIRKNSAADELFVKMAATTNVDVYCSYIDQQLA